MFIINQDNVLFSVFQNLISIKQHYQQVYRSFFFFCLLTTLMKVSAQAVENIDTDITSSNWNYRVSNSKIDATVDASTLNIGTNLSNSPINSMIINESILSGSETETINFNNDYSFNNVLSDAKSKTPNEASDDNIHIIAISKKTDHGLSFPKTSLQQEKIGRANGLIDLYEIFGDASLLDEATDIYRELLNMKEFTSIKEHHSALKNRLKIYLVKK